MLLVPRIEQLGQTLLQCLIQCPVRVKRMMPDCSLFEPKELQNIMMIEPKFAQSVFLQNGACGTLVWTLLHCQGLCPF
jgi:hypothetical protein